MPNIGDFMGLRVRNKVRDWGWDGETNEVCETSSMMLDQSRIKTQKKWVPNPAFEKEMKRQQKTGQYAPISASSGKLVDQKADLMDFVRDNMGGIKRGTIYKSEPKRKSKENY